MIPRLGKFQIRARIVCDLDIKGRAKQRKEGFSLLQCLNYSAPDSIGNNIEGGIHCRKRLQMLATRVDQNLSSGAHQHDTPSPELMYRSDTFPTSTM